MAERELAELWVAAADKQAFTLAADWIDRELARDPRAVGESRFGTTRVLIQSPIGIYYDVIEDDRVVAVWKIWSV